MKVSNRKQGCSFRREQLTPVFRSNLKVNLKSLCVAFNVVKCDLQFRLMELKSALRLFL